MKSRVFLCVVSFLVATGGIPHRADAAPQGGKANLTVSAAISLKEALDDARHAYLAKNSNVSIGINYGASGTLQLQIEQGAPVDIFLSAAPKQMEALEMKNLLLAGTRKDLWRNEIVLVVPKDGSSRVASFQDLARPGVNHVALGEPTSVPAGAYAKEALTNMGIYDAVKAKAILAKDVRQVLTYVETGNVDAGIVYSTDAQTSQKVKIVATAPENSHEPVIYPGAVIKDSKNSDAAKAFVNFLVTPQARAIFQKYGFAIATP